ncbi:MAG: GNAT family N-acetyltransferase [Actinomycetota bacterium]
MKSRAITTDDLPRVAQLLKDDEEFLLERPSLLGVNDVREWLSRTDLEHDSWLYEDDGELAAIGWVDVMEGSDVGFAIGVVHPRWKGRGIGAELLERSTERLRGRVPRMHQVAFGTDTAAAELMTSRGLDEVRRFYEMAIEQTEPPAPVDLPVETVTEADLRDFHAAMDEAFQDHWEHHSTPYDEWWERHSKNPNLDLSVWFLIRGEDGEVAAVSRNEANRNGGGYIGALGVRRKYRGKGYAKALLLHSFREFYERGMPRVTLGVDAQNPTGATHLYERVGMHVEMENVVFEKRFDG